MTDMANGLRDCLRAGTEVHASRSGAGVYSPAARQQRESFGTMRVLGLDLMRSVAILLVLVSHGICLPPWFPYPSQLIENCAYWGVEIFFILSGFLIGRILISEMTRPDGGDWVRFWLRRWIRTLPNYYLFLAVYSCMGGGFTAKFTVFAQNFAEYHPTFFAVAWSLSIEEWFYLLSPLVILLAGKFIRNKPRAILVAIGFFIVGGLAVRLVLHSQTTWSWTGFRTIVINRFDAIAWGFLAAYVSKFHGRLFQRAACWPVAAAALVVVGVQGALLTRYVYPGGMEFYGETLFFTVSSAALALLLPYWSQIDVKSNWVRQSITSISQWSYSAYLVHSLVLNSLGPRLYVCRGNGYLVFAQYMLLTMALSGLIYRVFERPIMQLRDGLLVRKGAVSCPGDGVAVV